MDEVVKLGMLALGGVVWLLRLEGRVQSHERVCEERQRQAAESREFTRAALARIEARLETLSDRSHAEHGSS